MDDRSILDFDRQFAGQVYVAISDGLTRWASTNDRLHLFKLGSSTRLAYERAASLNADWTLGFNTKPCLGFDDWRTIGGWSLYDNEMPRQFENRIRKSFAKILDPFNFREVHGATHAGNGETELFRIRPSLLAGLPGLFELHKPAGRAGRIAESMIETLLADVRGATA